MHTLMIGTVSAAALSRDDLSREEVPDNGIDRSGDPQEHFDIIGAEQFHCFRPHSPGQDMGDLMLCEEYREPARLMTGVL